MRTPIQRNQGNKMESGGKINENEYDKRQIKDLNVIKNLTKGMDRSKTSRPALCTNQENHAA